MTTQRVRERVPPGGQLTGRVRSEGETELGESDSGSDQGVVDRRLGEVETLINTGEFRVGREVFKNVGEVLDLGVFGGPEVRGFLSYGNSSQDNK